MRCLDGARERPSEHQMMIYSAKPYNQRMTTLNTHSCAKDTSHRYAQEGFGEAETAKYVNFFAQTPYFTAVTSMSRSRVRGCGIWKRRGGLARRSRTVPYLRLQTANVLVPSSWFLSGPLRPSDRPIFYNDILVRSWYLVLHTTRTASGPR